VHNEVPVPPAPNTISGTITFADPNGLVTGTAVFVIVKPTGGGVPLAVDKLVYQGAPLPFVLGPDKTMIDGAKIEGAVTVTARYDVDGDAVTKQPGDRIGTVDVVAPASGVALVIDHVIQ
jgi:hypothetical protein